MTATQIGDDLRPKLDVVALALGEYPHRKLDGKGRNNGPKKQSARMIKATCEDCDYLIRMARKWAEQGLPTCHCGGAFVCPDLDAAEEDADGGEDE